VLKRVVLTFSAGSAEAEYHDILTPYAAVNLCLYVCVVKQIKRMQHLQIVQDTLAHPQWKRTVGRYMPQKLNVPVCSLNQWPCHVGIYSR